MVNQADVTFLFKEWQARLKLGHWKITLLWDKPLDTDSDAWMKIECADFYDTAKIRVNLDFTEWTQAQANQLVVHELLHCYLRDMLGAAHSVKPLLGHDAFVLFVDRYEHGEEGVIDRLATLLVELAGEVKLPSKRKKRATPPLTVRRTRSRTPPRRPR